MHGFCSWRNYQVIVVLFPFTSFLYDSKVRVCRISFVWIVAVRLPIFRLTIQLIDMVETRHSLRYPTFTVLERAVEY